MQVISDVEHIANDNAFIIIYGMGKYGLKFRDMLKNVNESIEYLFCDRKSEGKVVSDDCISPKQLIAILKTRKHIKVIISIQDDAIADEVIEDLINTFPSIEGDIFRFKYDLSKEADNRRKKGYFNGKEYIKPCND